MSGLAPGSTIGIIGGGQLGRMLAMAAARLGYKVVVLEPEPDCPAAQVTNRQIVAPYADEAALAELAERADVITYEFENVPVAAAENLAGRRAVFPPPKALAISQDRLTEKRFLNDCGIKTARFSPVDDDDDLAAALEAFGGDGVLKTRRLGYDGKGQRVFRNASKEDADGVWQAMGGVPLILEEFVPFACEISVIAARGQDGALSAFDPAQNVHREGILRRSTAPAKVSASLANEAAEAAFRLLEALDYVGVIGLEFFVTSNGQLIANEFAPRVHNSGHWTEAACAVSQFEQHIRAVAGLPLAAPERHSDAIMENLIGDDVEKVDALLREPGLVLHLYGKKDVRPGRKMGHFTRLSPKS